MGTGRSCLATVGAVTGETGRRLVLVRHAKSAWPDVADRDRPLAKRGRRQAPLAGAWLRSAGYRPDLVLCSPALRTRDTWQLVAAELGTAAKVRYDERVYGASAASLLELVHEVPASVQALFLVGHSPGLPDLAIELAGDGPRAAGADALERLTAKFPTGAVAVLDVPGKWRDLAHGGARLADFVIPRDLEH
jgi:phosphohistidine phosphatase